MLESLLQPSTEASIEAEEGNTTVELSHCISTQTNPRMTAYRNHIECQFNTKVLMISCLAMPSMWS